jgi:endonuclease/exonuclease/phosphatase family metal-dependent hydrolase
MTFSIMFWNIWFYNQIEGEVRTNRLLGELKRFIEQYEPDFVALNEAVRPAQARLAPVVESIQKLGYKYNHCANMGQLNDYWMSGAVLCSRFKLSQKQNIVISKNGYALKKGYADLDKEIISAQVILSEGQELKIMVAHPVAIIDSLKEHRIGMESLSRLVHSEAYGKNTLLVGDMNEWRLIPGAFKRKVMDLMDSRTGSMLHPTWRYNAHRFTPLRANLDYVYWNKQSDFDLKDLRVLVSSVSDHRPFLATFELVR